MKTFQYEITKHSTQEFKHLAYFCTDRGECKIDELPAGQISVLKEILNKKGGQGWELIQIFLNEDGILAFWKKEA